MVDFIQTENSVIKRYYDMGDGPDVVTITVTKITGNQSVLARLSWTEAQA